MTTTNTTQAAIEQTNEPSFAFPRPSWVPPANIVAAAGTEGRIAAIYGCPLTIDEAQRALSEAAYRAFYPGDKWQVDIVLVPMRDVVLDRTRLDAQSPFQATPPRFDLGLIGVTK
jgi:hypothetical protein